MEIVGDKWHRVQFDIKFPENMDAEVIHNSLIKCFQDWVKEPETYIYVDGIRVWGEE